MIGSDRSLARGHFSAALQKFCLASRCPLFYFVASWQMEWEALKPIGGSRRGSNISLDVATVDELARLHYRALASKVRSSSSLGPFFSVGRRTTLASLLPTSAALAGLNLPSRQSMMKRRSMSSSLVLELTLVKHGTPQTPDDNPGTHVVHLRSYGMYYRPSKGD